MHSKRLGAHVASDYWTGPPNLVHLIIRPSVHGCLHSSYFCFFFFSFFLKEHGGDHLPSSLIWVRDLLLGSVLIAVLVLNNTILRRKSIIKDHIWSIYQATPDWIAYLISKYLMIICKEIYKPVERDRRSWWTCYDRSKERRYKDVSKLLVTLESGCQDYNISLYRFGFTFNDHPLLTETEGLWFH